MADDLPPSRPRPSLLAAVRGAVSLAVEHAFTLVAANLAWATVVAAFALALVIVPPLIVALPVLALPTSALTRLAITAVRSGVPTLRIARDELARLPLRKLGLAAVQVVVLGISVANIALAGQIGGIPGLLSAGVALYAILVTGIYATALWPIVCDPLRAAPLRDQLRLAAIVTVRRPLQLGLLAIVSGLAVAASVQVPVLALFAPAILLLAIAGYVVPAVDEIAPLPG